MPVGVVEGWVGQEVFLKLLLQSCLVLAWAQIHNSLPFGLHMRGGVVDRCGAAVDGSTTGLPLIACFAAVVGLWSWLLPLAEARRHDLQLASRGSSCLRHETLGGSVNGGWAALA